MTLDPALARQAKADLANRLTAIALKYVPDGWTVEYRKSLSGRAWGDKKLIQTPRPVTRRALHIFLHECGHAHLHFNGKKQKRYIEEYQAEQFAFEIMRKEGIAIPRQSLERAKRYVARKIKQAEVRGAKSIDPDVRKWAA